VLQRRDHERSVAGTSVAVGDVVLRLAALAAAAAAACTGEIVDPDGDPVGAAMACFDRTVAPALSAKCAVCHAGDEVPKFFVSAPSLREGVLGFDGGKLVDLDRPEVSRLAIYPASQRHAQVGTNYTQAEAAQVVAWVVLEARADGRTPAPAIATARVTPVPGLNTIDLAAAGLPGTRCTFEYQALSTGMYLSSIAIEAGPGGAHLVHPLWVAWDGAIALPDPIDRFGDVDLTVPAATRLPIGVGTAVLLDVPPGAPLSLHFLVAEAAS
jgi:hypothetical protein